MKKIITPVLSLFAFASLLATETEINTALKIGTSTDTNQVETIAAGDSWKIVTGGSIAIGNGTDQNGTLNIYGTLDVNLSGDNIIIMGNANVNRNLTNINLDGGTISNSSGGVAKFYFGKDGNPGSQATVDLKNNSSITGSFNIEFARNASTTMNIDSTSVVNIGSGTLEMGMRNTANVIGIINVNGGSLTAGNFRMARSTSTGGNSTINVNGGGSVLVTTEFTMSDSTSGTDSVSYVNLTGAGSTFTVTGTRSALGKGSGTYANSVAEFKIGTGAKASMKDVYVNQNGHFTFALDSDNYVANAAAMLDARSITVVKDTAASPSASFYVDGALLSFDSSFVEGNSYNFALFEVTNGKLNFDGVDYLISGSDFLTKLAEYLAFENNTGLDDWENFDASNLYVSGNTIGISLTYVPEPATYAAIFGALALAFAAYKRRKQ